MTLRFTGNRIAAAAAIGVLTCGTISACKPNQDTDKTNAMLSRVVQKCVPLIEQRQKCEKKPRGFEDTLSCYDAYVAEGGTLSKENFTRVEDAMWNSVVAGSSSEAVTTAAISTHDAVVESKTPTLLSLWFAIGAGIALVGAAMRSFSRID